ncbi:hypothetical protein KUCAC02_020162 [Chaenocephalus aceratus]|uniref:Uncharacterized protein n=1 Tax=Chaenocephalus aceratus TaxID=36190 RepID=A0ACB9VRK1_CHAAC|nr:hypothetical protein KUCAC02_020162 [Chaenocephalus aceratus]
MTSKRKNLSMRPIKLPQQILCPAFSLPNLTPQLQNPFKIKKVKSSDLKSFQRIVEQEEDQLGQMDRASSLGAGLNLSVPMEILEIISDSEEGDAMSVLPDWLKEGEFVTVGEQ